MAIGIETTASNIATFLSNIAPILSLILFILSGIVYGLSQMQPPEARGKWQTAAISMFVGAIIVAAIAVAAPMLVDVSSNLLV